jgi:hypothetical protein
VATDASGSSGGALPAFLPATEYTRTPVLARLRGALQLAWRYDGPEPCAHCGHEGRLLGVHLPPDRPVVLCPTCALTHVYGPRED